MSEVSIYADKPPYHNHNSFVYWRGQGYVPTARLDGRTEWLAVKNLRHMTARSAVACPHDMRGFIELERLHEAISKRIFYDPYSDDHSWVCYVSMIPRPVVEWFSQRTLIQVHREVALYLALRIAVGGDREWVLKDSFHVYRAKIIDDCRILDAKIPDGLHSDFQFLAEYAERLPPWLRPYERTAANGLNYWTLPHCEQGMPWERPQHSYIDELGVVCHGLTASDERGIDAAVFKEANRGRDTSKKKVPEERPLNLDDKLERSEACPDAFEHLTYARYVKSSWGAPWAGEEKGKIYLVQDGHGCVKIGWTSGDPAKRLAALQTGSATPLRLLGVVPGPQTLEQHLHCQYADLKAHEGRTEWFSLRPIDVLEILGFV